jgi:hypothetical protein
MNEVSNLRRWISALKWIQSNRSLGPESSVVLTVVIRDLDLKLQDLRGSQTRKDKKRKILFKAVARLSWLFLLEPQILDEITKHWRDNP